MKSTHLPVFTSDPADIEIVDVPIPEPGPGQVRVRMHLSPVNPSDLNYVHGTYHDALERINRILRKLHKEPLDEMPDVVEAHEDKPGFVEGMMRLLHDDQRKKTLTLWAAFLM